MMASSAPRVDAVVNAVGAGAHGPVTLKSLAAARRSAQVPGQDAVVVRDLEDEEIAEGATRCGIRVCLLAPRAPRTPGAARNLGSYGMEAEYLLFLDGDIVLEEGFLGRAVAHLESDSQCAAFGGRLDERHWIEGRQVGGAGDLYQVRAGGPTLVLGALWVCRRSAFEEVGRFDPDLPSEEDFELSLRLRLAGYTLWAEARLAGYHDCAPRPSFRELGRRWRSGLYAGQGLALRKYWGRPGFGELVARQRFFLAAFAVWTVGLVALGAALAGKPQALVAWTALVLAAWLLMSLRKRSPRLGLMSLLTWSVQGLALVRSLVFGPWGEMATSRGADL